jgi:hypothetical protein
MRTATGPRPLAAGVGEGPPPGLTARTLLRGALAGTAVVLVVSWLAPGLPDDVHGADLVQRGLLADEVRGVPSWWMAVLFAVAALGAHAQAVAVRERVDAGRAAPLAWWAVAAAAGWVSVDHTVGLHSRARQLTRDVLPGLLGERPVEVLLVATVVPAGLVLIARAAPGQRALLALAALAFVLGQVVVGDRLVRLGTGSAGADLVEISLQYAAGLLVLAAAARPPGTR